MPQSACTNGSWRDCRRSEGTDREATIKRADEEYWQEAARLSDMLIAPVAKRIAGKRLLVVADGMLQYVPFPALPVPRAGAEPVPMLAEHEIVSLPSASVLAVLRREDQAGGSRQKAVAVFADPVFEVDDPRLRGRGRSGEPASDVAHDAAGASQITGVDSSGRPLEASAGGDASGS